LVSACRPIRTTNRVVLVPALALDRTPAEIPLIRSTLAWERVDRQPSMLLVAVLASGLIACLLTAAAANAAGRPKPITLGPGQAVVIAKTDIVCVFGGPANEIGIGCLHETTGTYSFRIDENLVRGLRTQSGKLSQVGSWKEPRTLKQAGSPVVSSFKVVATLPLGGRFIGAGTDIGCLVIGVGAPLVACFKLGAGKGYPVAGSYAATLGTGGLEVDRYDAAHHGKSVFIGREAK
jgi:hypothetical protein